MLRAIYIVYYGYRPVSFNEVYPRSFVWVQPSVFVYVFVLGVLKIHMVYSCASLHILYTSVTLYVKAAENLGVNANQIFRTIMIV
jgi:ABC-type dipeptide/oligopeptide/nickel transport system permease subunit